MASVTGLCTTHGQICQGVDILILCGSMPDMLPVDGIGPSRLAAGAVSAEPPGTCGSASCGARPAEKQCPALRFAPVSHAVAACLPVPPHASAGCCSLRGLSGSCPHCNLYRGPRTSLTVLR